MTVLPQRPLRGSRISSFYPVKTLPSLSSLDSAFQLQEYISLLIRLDVHDVDAIVSLPGKSSGKEKEAGSEESDGKEEKVAGAGEDNEEKGKNDVTVDEACWIYEQLRRQCCAIDYILHTLDSATALLNTPRAFPSRLQIPATSHRHFSSLARRLGRIFAHAYFHHREAFEQAEAESSLYARFLALTSKFDLVPSEFVMIPPRSTDHDQNERTSNNRDLDVQPPRLLAAALDPRASIMQQDAGRRRSQQQQNVPPIVGQWDRRGSVVPPVVTVIERTKSGDSPPGLGSGSESPRKMGRNRTDTMVLHEAFAVAEELAKVDRAEATDEQPQPVQEIPASNVPLPMEIAVPDTHDELLSPADDAPATAKPRADTIEVEDTANSLPESPIIKSPVAPSLVSLPAEEILTPETDSVIEKTENEVEPDTATVQPEPPEVEAETTKVEPPTVQDTEEPSEPTTDPTPLIEHELQADSTATDTTAEPESTATSTDVEDVIPEPTPIPDTTPLEGNIPPTAPAEVPVGDDPVPDVAPETAQEEAAADPVPNEVEEQGQELELQQVEAEVHVEGLAPSEGDLEVEWTEVNAESTFTPEEKDEVVAVADEPSSTTDADAAVTDEPAEAAEPEVEAHVEVKDEEPKVPAIATEVKVVPQEAVTESQVETDSAAVEAEGEESVKSAPTTEGTTLSVV
ncbi:hypothetical protein H0H81_011640 [Sphagnurus paluster]|uniref:Mob1/phocein n=1 Tax=Sphagnurus paluster TaxID=117069 RepID=A0A9P7GLA5_9AGAR|nr:hypothetical protein H0H81_011640 [Sphagnurus paluster]